MTKFVPKRRPFSLRMPHGTVLVARPARVKNVIVENGKCLFMFITVQILSRHSWCFSVGRIIRHQIHRDWPLVSTMTSFKISTFMLSKVLKVSLPSNEIGIFFKWFCLERREIYFVAIIDVLTQYGVKKQVCVYWCVINKWRIINFFFCIGGESGQNRKIRQQCRRYIHMWSWTICKAIYRVYRQGNWVDQLWKSNKPQTQITHTHTYIRHI